jgi:hypothetical protein
MPIHLRRVPDDNDVPTDRGTYRRIREYWADYCASRGKPNTFWAEICCPGCGIVGMLGSNHTVADDGTVAPSDVCPYPPCTFHDHIVLDDWDRPSTDRRREADDA